MNFYTVHPIASEQCKPWLLGRHYARRVCPISYAFGLYNGVQLVGVCTFGVPASPTLRNSICGQEEMSYVHELNRLVVDKQPRNVLSWFVAECLRRLPPMIVVSFADTEQGHHGYIYQATNWIYTGLSAKRTDWKVKGKEHLHGVTIADEFRGQENRAQLMRQKYGDDFYLEARPRKHRYVYLIGSKTQRKRWRKALNYAVEPYPKGQNRRYEEAPIYTQAKLF